MFNMMKDNRGPKPLTAFDVVNYHLMQWMQTDLSFEWIHVLIDAQKTKISMCKNL